MAATDRFPIPPTGSPIPRGWFARLVAFINSLVLHGDGRFTLVNRSAAGTTVTLTPSLINRLNQSAPAPSSGGGACIPNYAAGESVTIGQAYAITSPGWLIGYVRAAFPGTAGDYYAEWTLSISQGGTPITQITLASQRFAGGSTLEITSFISILLPAGVSFSVSLSSNLASGSTTHTLKAYPCI